MEIFPDNSKISEGTGEPMVFAEDPPQVKEYYGAPWKILVVDDDLEVHRMTKFVLTEKILVGRPLELLFASSVQEAEELLITDEIACTLLDVVMEKEDSGLTLVKKIRDTMGNSKIRIILRTGQPGRAPEHSIMEQYEINDYREKTELPAQKLIPAVMSAIRSYRDIEIIEKSKKFLRMIIHSSDRIFGFQPFAKYAEEALLLFDSLLQKGNDGVFAVVTQTAGNKGSPVFTIIAGIGAYSQFVGMDAKAVLDCEAFDLMKAAVEGRKTVYGGICFAMDIKGSEKNESVLFMKYRSPDYLFERELLDVSHASIKSAYTNLTLYNEVEKLARERGALLKEVDHRVKNNLQVISSLIDFEVSDLAADSETRLINIRNRIQSMAAIHDCFYGCENIDMIDFKDVAQSIVEIVAGNEPCSRNVKRDFDFKSVRLSFDKAIPCSLIFGELVFNAFRHAANSPEREEIAIRVGAANGRLLIGVRAGSAAGAGTNDLARNDSVSNIIVQALVSQLSGDFHFSVSEGMAADISLPL